MRFLLPHNKPNTSWVENANTVLAGPVSGAPAHPQFRRLVTADLDVTTFTESQLVDIITAICSNEAARTVLEQTLLGNPPS